MFERCNDCSKRHIFRACPHSELSTRERQLLERHGLSAFTLSKHRLLHLV